MYEISVAMPCDRMLGRCSISGHETCSREYLPENHLLVSCLGGGIAVWVGDDQATLGRVRVGGVCTVSVHDDQPSLLHGEV